MAQEKIRIKMGVNDVLRLSTRAAGALSLKWGKRHDDLYGACLFKGQSRSLICDIVYLISVVYAIIWFQVHCIYLSLCYAMKISINTFSLSRIKWPFFLSMLFIVLLIMIY